MHSSEINIYIKQNDVTFYLHLNIKGINHRIIIKEQCDVNEMSGTWTYNGMTNLFATIIKGQISKDY